MNVLLTAWDTKPEAHQGDVPTSLTDTHNVFLCRSSCGYWLDELADERKFPPHSVWRQTCAMGEVLFHDIVHTDYGQFDVVWGDGFGFDGDFDRFFDGQVNGLVGAADPNGFYVNLARRSGGSAIVIELLHAEPTVLDEEWADVVEVSISVPSVPGDGRPTWSSWAGQSGGDLDIPAGHYRVRVSARGRDAGHDGEFADAVLDHYRIELWPAARRPDAVIRSGSADGQYWHTAVGDRR